MKNSVAVVYLARSADGIASFQHFAASYRQFPAGLEHDLVVIFKGFTSATELSGARSCFTGRPHLAVVLDDSGYDIGSYRRAVLQLKHAHVLFLNTHSTIESANWLAHFHRYGSQEGCGIAGATGSYESLYDTVRYLEAAILASLTARGTNAERLARAFDFLLPRFRPDWYEGGSPKQGERQSLWQRIGVLLKPPAASPRVRGMPSARGPALIWPGASDLDVEVFPRFPNPHIRSNGFMIRRDRFISLTDMNFHAKSEANYFESGCDSLTTRLRRAGLDAVLVGADGEAYPVPDWPNSRTFRLGAQNNLLVGDNHTRAFASMSALARQAHTLMTWGQYAPHTKNVPRLGFQFSKGLLAAV